MKYAIRRFLAADPDALAQEALNLSIFCVAILAMFSVPLGL
ncbi:MAG: hypothetical protein AAGG56_11475 [Pseudomonadota bacterium]